MSSAPKNKQIPKAYLTLDEVVALLRVSRMTFYVWRRAGFFPPGILMGPRRLVFESDKVAAWIASRPVSQVRPIQSA